MHMHILGLGSVGCLVAHAIRRALPASTQITTILRTLEKQTLLEEKKYIRVEHKGVVTGADSFTPELFRTSQLSPLASNPHYSPIDSLWVTMKAQQTVPAI